MSKKRVLVSTLFPGGGGVIQMASFVTQCLSERGFDPVVAYYEPYSKSPELSVPSFRLFQRTLGRRIERVINNYEAHAIGAWLPEFEFTNFLPTWPWKEVMQSCDYYVCVSGSCLACLPFAMTGRKFLAWVATPWHEDRKDRVALFPWPRRVLDKMINSKVITHLEKNMLRKGTILSLSRYTATKLNNLAQNDIICDILPMPVDIESFSYDCSHVVPGRIGFVGRFDDPRKNITLLLQSARRCRDDGHDVSVTLVGDIPTGSLRASVESLGLEALVDFVPYMQREALPRLVQTFDVFVIPSHQEGLCIAGIEAMACGCPVVSTRCGGPEEFVIDGQTGLLVDYDSNSMSHAISRIVSDRKFRMTLSEGARLFVEKNYTLGHAREIFWRAFDKTFH